MNQIICDVCGSAYPETEERCPVCSYPRQGNEKTAAASGAAAQTKVKGGRFSSKNVKKRQKAQKKAEKQGNPNKPLIIVIVLLLLAIVLVALYIGARFFRGRDAYQPAVQTTAAQTVPCTELELENPVLDLEEPGQQKQLTVRLLPADTTDRVSFVSADPNVVQVDENGLLTAVGSGQTTVTVTCGAASQVCTVVCWFREETTAPAQTQPAETSAPTETTQPPVPETAELTLEPNDASCFRLNEAFPLTVMLGSSTIDRSQVTWSTSNSEVAKVRNGTVTAVGQGTATITAEYEGKKAQCIVRCRFEEDSSWSASATDVTLDVGLSFQLTVTNGSGEMADAVWSASEEGIVSVNGATVTAKASGTVTLKTTVEGTELTCIVRVP